MNTIEKDILKVLISEAELKARVREIGARIAMDYENKDPLFVGVLRGSFMFFADLMRVCPIPCGLDFLAASSYKMPPSAPVWSRSIMISAAISRDGILFWWRIFWTAATRCTIWRGI